MGFVRDGVRIRLLAAAAITALAIATPVRAQEGQRREYNVEAQNLGDALRTVSRLSGREVIFTAEAVEGKNAPRLRGTYTPDDAVRALLEGSGLTAEFRKDVVLIRGRSEAPGEVANDPAAQSEILVTGSRIRGAQSASPVISISRDEIESAGQRNITDVLAAIPQNFTGGQNPGVGQGVGGSNNTSSATSFNLRGAGPDATLTLLNGHRIAYNAQYQAIDVSSIPFSAIERIEIVPDGSSALYGSDAVAGVANVILRPDYDGLLTDVKLSGSTDGGAETQQYGVLAGATWASGGFMVAYEFERSTAIYGRDRSYAKAPSPGLTLYPSLKHHNAAVSGHLSITSNLNFRVDGLYNKRWSDRYSPVDSRADYLLNGIHIATDTEAFAIAPSLELKMPNRWQATLSGSYAQDHSRFNQEQFLNGSLRAGTYICYCNTAGTVEINADGPLFTLPGGDAKVAIGAGYRANHFQETRQKIHASQEISYGFGELSLPLIAPDVGIPLVRRLTVTAAVRFEKPSQGDGVATPKLGLVHSPTSGFEVRGTWGRSFRTPTLFQQYQSKVVALFTAASRGGSNYPSGSTVLLLQGGSPDLKPEKASTWSTSVALDPSWLPGLHLEATYFDIDYSSRIVAPVGQAARALSNPAYADLITFSPSASDIADVLAGGTPVNTTPTPFDPSKVVAIIHNQNLNVASQTLSGVDVSGTYRFSLADDSTVTLSLAGSYLDSKRRLSALQPELPLAGVVFNPPHLRARAGAVWRAGPSTLAAYANYISGVEDTRVVPTNRVEGMTTVDISGRHSFTRGPRLLRGLTVSVTIQNLFNVKPDTIVQQSLVAESPYDSTNYSPLGRVVAFSLSKSW